MLHGGAVLQVKYPPLTRQYGITCFSNLTDILATEDMSVH